MSSSGQEPLENLQGISNQQKDPASETQEEFFSLTNLIKNVNRHSPLLSPGVLVTFSQFGIKIAPRIHIQNFEIFEFHYENDFMV